MIRKLVHVALPAVLLLAVAGAARGAQVRITGILGPDSAAVETTDDVELIPWGSFSGGGIRVGQPLGAGDELRAVSGRTIVELTCADTAVFTLTDRFRVVIRDQAASCRVDIGSGEVYVVGSENTAAEVGGVTMGAVRTVYVITAGRDRAGPVRRLTVFEGLVSVRWPEERTLEVQAGNVLHVGREPRTERVSESDISRAASLYTRMDLARARLDARTSRDAYTRLYRAHVRVLEAPDDQAGRLQLIGEQIRYDATSRTTLYHIEHIAPQTGEARAATDALAAVAYAQLGRTAQAELTSERLRSVDRALLQRAIREYQLEGTAVADVSRIPQDRRLDLTRYARVADSLHVTVQTDPSTVRAGQATRIIVTVRSSAGRPAPGAAVTVSAGGGEFIGALGLELHGVTGDDGVFTTAWRCQRCASGYEFRARATRRGFTAGEGAGRVAVR